MIPTSATALFCEDIRQEVENRITLVGIFPDNVNIAEMPPDTLGVQALPKLCVFARISFDVRRELKSIGTRIINPDGTETPLAGVAEKVLQEAISGSLAQGNSIANVNINLQMAPFLIPSFGRMTFEATVGDETFVCGTINFQKAPART